MVLVGAWSSLLFSETASCRPSPVGRGLITPWLVSASQRSHSCSLSCNPTNPLREEYYFFVSGLYPKVKPIELLAMLAARWQSRWDDSGGGAGAHVSRLVAFGAHRQSPYPRHSSPCHCIACSHTRLPLPRFSLIHTLRLTMRREICAYIFTRTCTCTHTRVLLILIVNDFRRFSMKNMTHMM